MFPSTVTKDESVRTVLNLIEISWYVRNHMLKVKLVIMLEIYTRIFYQKYIYTRICGE